MSEQAADDGITHDSWSVSNEIHHGAKSLESESEAEPICRRRSVSRPRLPFLGTYAISSVPHPHLFRPLSTTQSPRLEPFVPFEDTLLDGFDIEALDLNLFYSIDGSTDYQDDVFLDVITSIPESQIVESQSQPNVPDEAEVLVSEAPDELEIRSSRSVAHSSLTQHDISVDWTSIYKGYWGNNCLSALHPVFHKITDLISQVPVLEDAIVALAACNLSRSSPKPKSPGVAGNVSYQPHPEHWASSQQHYRSALTATRHMTEAVTQGMDPQITMTILVLFSCLESSIGNFLRFHNHSRGIANLIRRLSTGLDPTSSMTDILAAWMQTRYHSWWIRLYFSTFTFQLEQSSLSAPESLEDNIESNSVRRAMILSILCESHRLHQKMLLGTFLLASDQTTINLDSTDQRYKAGMYRELLTLQAEKLIIWEQNLPLADLPASLEGEVQYLFPEGLLVTPLQFSSHNAAMNYAYFISARLMQDAPIDLSGEHITDSDHWVFLLLRITAGIDRQTCLRDNTYTIGLSSLLLAALLHTCSLDIGIWIEDWLQGFQKNAQNPALEEGSFPLAQITTVVSVINQQRRLGRNVFAVSQAEDDGGGNGKVDSYDSQDIKVVWLHGRERATGARFQEPVRFGA
ncbi:hypothetical protein M438DRAFT_263855 [Aureobasidium pullulans EXF-150]|uniref:Transcription factor domain-containing protein n=1 Tax=Aureobasidium pullulans EXF-150 TaxID=1043002 RepID=A0A074Y6Q3_AURPU|nr:uncharacterized protein M438DRAFT_263855 [Aureobasidium pullulans EXF-150]KEQ89917.1 hypothetical protein M438DRAFT_263855 [Aureobasidium pullulans EXF-150]